MKSRSQENFESKLHLLKDLAEKGEYSIDLTKEEHLKIAKECIDTCCKEAASDGDEDEDDENALTVAASKGNKIAISVEGFDVMKLRSQLIELKKVGSAKEITFKFTQTPHSVDEAMANLQLHDKSIKVSGQALYTVGDYFTHDIWLPKARCLFGMQTAICSKSDGFYALDVGAMDETMIRLKKDVEYPLAANNVINFSSAVTYGVDNLAAGSLKLRHLKTIKASTGKQAEFKGENMEGKIGADGLLISKLKGKGKLKVGHSMVSGAHATVTATSIKDTSTNGTYLLLKNLAQYDENISSEWFKLEAGAEISFSDYILQMV